MEGTMEGSMQGMMEGVSYPARCLWQRWSVHTWRELWHACTGTVLRGWWSGCSTMGKAMGLMFRLASRYLLRVDTTQGVVAPQPWMLPHRPLGDPSATSRECPAGWTALRTPCIACTWRLVRTVRSLPPSCHTTGTRTRHSSPSLPLLHYSLNLLLHPCFRFRCCTKI
jgi:hypothetical protein